MKKIGRKSQILVAVGTNFIFWGMTLNHFGMINDLFDGLMKGLGIALTIGALFVAKRSCQNTAKLT